MYQLVLKKKEEMRLLGGHPWVYANEVLFITGEGTPGSIAKVCNHENRFIGLGYINHQSKIIVRLLSRVETEINRDFFFERIKAANDYRHSLGYNNNYRVVFGESDLLPGLIVDKYGEYLVVQILTLGMDVRKDMIVDILVELFSPRGIYERSDVPVREKEGLKQVKGLLYGEVPALVEIVENDLKLMIDVQNGQKTGYFLDQKENRHQIEVYAKDKEVLDCFCNIGGFSLCSAKGGAKAVTSLDISQKALDQLVLNQQVNGLENITPVCCDVFDQLRIYHQEKRKFDVIVLDPPAFTKSFDTVKEGMKGYRDINIQALKLIRSGGYLITCSCSQHFTLPLFLQMIQESVTSTGVRAQIVEIRSQGKDHPMLIGLDEGWYLKVAILHIL
ncbi:MAG: class I SAM-dependent rRNA methyltransferase [Bacilli bacterium]|nr:class I SAM-dependent rRNA methyltransferase [Bacilli bacterium]